MIALLPILSIIPNIGYHVYAKKEASFVRHPISGYADVVFYCDMMYNPLLYPTYWMKGLGRITDDFTMIYIPESYSSSEFAGGFWGVDPTSRYDDYVLRLVTADVYVTLAYFVLLAIIVEIIGKREVYIPILLGVIGFATAEIVGMVIGLLFGIALALFWAFKSPKSGTVRRFWRTLIEAE
jgi:hypothetical protein